MSYSFHHIVCASHHCCFGKHEDGFPGFAVVVVVVVNTLKMFSFPSLNPFSVVYFPSADLQIHQFHLPRSQMGCDFHFIHIYSYTKKRAPNEFVPFGWTKMLLTFDGE